MNRQTDPEPVAPFDPAAALPINEDSRVDLDAAGERIRGSLWQERVGVAVALLRRLLAADQGVFPTRAANRATDAGCPPTNERIVGRTGRSTH